MFFLFIVINTNQSCNHLSTGKSRFLHTSGKFGKTWYDMILSGESPKSRKFKYTDTDIRHVQICWFFAKTLVIFGVGGEDKFRNEKSKKTPKINTK